MITVKAELLRTLDAMKTDLSRLEESHRSLHATAVQISVLYDSLSKKVEEVSRIAQMGGSRSGSAFPPSPSLPGALPLASRAQMAAGSPSPDTLMLATKEMQEMNMSFNLQYLQLQQKMQSDNRQFTMISNIMKTKHDTAKNAINNVR